MIHQHDGGTIPPRLDRSHDATLGRVAPKGSRLLLVLAAGVAAAFVAVFGGRTLLDAAGSALLG